jgi:hypothetical protein
MASRTSSTGWWRRLRFFIATLALRARFATGKASFVEADIQMTTNQVAEVLELPGKAPERRLLAHYQLKTRKPLTGSQGWRLFAERAQDAGTGRLVELNCSFCGHRFVIQVLAAIDPLSSEVTQGRAPGHPASYASDWFKFMNSDYEGTPSLYCFHCEQNATPRVKFRNEPRESAS